MKDWFFCFRQGGPESYVGEGTDLGVDRDTVQVFTAGIIQEAAKIGNCVIFGRSAQCILRRYPRCLFACSFTRRLRRNSYG